jgi:hypothetical protein
MIARERDEQQTTDRKKTSKPLSRAVLKSRAADYKRESRPASSSLSSSSSSSYSSSSSSKSSSSRNSSSSPSNSWNMGPDDSSEISRLSVENSESYNKQYPKGNNTLDFAVKQSKKDKKELERTQRDIQRELERVKNGRGGARASANVQERKGCKI